MGVDFYSCAQCGECFPDCGPYFTCSSCEQMFCCDECGVRKVEQPGEKRWQDVTSCLLCRKEDVTDSTLLYFVLNKFNLSYEEAVELYKKEG
ncbi:MAG TPA: hypothetical protein VM577_09455 [Anaerovoracaceae bacterium]|nr:hypothetical protein [Anaerovoracaceae bacterium]